MPRTGQNPMKWTEGVHHPEKITVTTVVHIPFLDGYWKESLEVLRLCLQSMRENTRVPFDLMVFDNGSCKETQDYLLEMKDDGKIQYLILSEHNFGRVGAMNFLLPSAPGEIVSFTDSDVYFLPDWLEETIKVLEAFPEAGMITAQPIIGGISKNGTSFCEAIKKDPTISFRRGDLVPEECVKAHVIGLGISLEEFLKQKEGREDLLITRGEVSAYVSGSHYQFTTTKKVIQSLPVFKVTGLLGKDDMKWDCAIADLNLWRLTTIKYLAHHMGNKLPFLKDEIGQLCGKGPFPKGVFEYKPSSKNRLLRSPLVRRFLKGLNILIYRLLYNGG